MLVVVDVVKSVVDLFTHDAVFFLLLAFLTYCQMTAFTIYYAYFALTAFQAGMTQIWRLLWWCFDRPLDHTLPFACLVGFFFKNTCLNTVIDEFLIFL